MLNSIIAIYDINTQSFTYMYEASRCIECNFDFVHVSKNFDNWFDVTLLVDKPGSASIEGDLKGVSLIVQNRLKVKGNLINVTGNCKVLSTEKDLSNLEVVSDLIVTQNSELPNDNSPKIVVRSNSEGSVLIGYDLSEDTTNAQQIWRVGK